LFMHDEISIRLVMREKTHPSSHPTTHLQELQKREDQVTVQVLAQRGAELKFSCHF
jgi:hypothetical protein